jgi:hypothetical protein
MFLEHEDFLVMARRTKSPGFLLEDFSFLSLIGLVVPTKNHFIYSLFEDVMMKTVPMGFPQYFFR